MNYQQDWIMRQIETIIKFIRDIFSNRKSMYNYGNLDKIENELLKNKIAKLIQHNKFSEAETMILEKIDNGVKFDIEIALGLYETMNLLSDSELDELGFSREKILKGIKNICLKCQVLDSNTLDLFINNIPVL